MKLQWEDNRMGWRKRFALFPIYLEDGNQRQFIWLEWVWKRNMGLYIEVSVESPIEETPKTI